MTQAHAPAWAATAGPSDAGYAPPRTAAAPRVSVVMPVFNGEAFIAEAVASVLASTFPYFELLVIDDASTDASVERAREAADGDPRLRVLTVPRGGVAAARNVALSEARAELIANLDADDAMFPERLARQVAHLARHPECVAVGARALVVDAAGRPQRLGGRYFTHEEIDGAHLAGLGGAIWNPTATFRRRAALDVGGYDASLATGEDTDLWMRLAEVGRLANLPEVLVRYRVHHTNVSLVAGEGEQRAQVRLRNVARAFARRRIVDRAPTLEAAPPLGRAERWCDAAMLRYFRGDRRGALPRALAACVAAPGSPAARAAVRAIVRGPAPQAAR